MKSNTITAFAVTFALTGCTLVGPDYQSPSIDLPARFIDGDATATGEVAAQQWWLNFGDATLTDLVQRGMAQNLDVRTATERINQAAAALQGTGQAAQVSGSGSVSSTLANTGEGSTTTTNSGNLAASYVFDIFGGVQREQEQATAALEGAVYDVGTARLALLASLVGNYIDARYFQEAIALTRESIQTRRQTVTLTRQQQEQGAVSELDLVNAEALLNDALADLPALETGFYAAVYGIATLLGEPAGPITSVLERGAPQPRPSGGSDAGVPADTLRNRPDVNSAERALAEATAGIGVATADLYPSLDLDGTVTASDPSSWTFGPTLSLPILNQSALRAARDQQVSLARQADLTWRNTVLTAVEEVQTAQTSYLRLQREVEARRAAAQSYERALELSTATYQAGAISLLDLLDAERANAAAQLALAASTQDLANAWVTLQITAGRGWKTVP
ncbi:efflux transporter outer membrane subunit [Octadecabacter sp. G9-8]|uniref:Efflux transporter outer membrane subunit n=1 Tax=Octadecabacter dasysiphoniae TaxID=2909341 RepID=A0ABS9CWI5_9RHOB|nr:efflux transporter outer membrane subunit [Octadecabacter dasysiphoniae]MCF2870750.1 efflux transporter outer membrane subunit [Octadecabacter dasysiphoniae]